MVKPGDQVQWYDGTRTRRGRIVGVDRSHYYTIESTDGARFVLPEGRLTLVDSSVSETG